MITMEKDTKNIILIVNTFLLIVFVIVWISELYGTINYDSMLFSRDIYYENNKNKLSVLTGIIILIVLGAFLLIMGIKKKILIAEIISVLAFSIIALIVLREKISSYLPFQNYESFVWIECLMVYYSMISFLISLSSGVLLLVKK